MAFEGLSRETRDFLSDLAANNERSWFEANRERYDRFWKSPALDLVEALSPLCAGLDPPLNAVPKIGGSLRRINRDIRFSKDKSPYNPMLHLVFFAGDSAKDGVGVHLVIHPDRLGFGAGRYGMEGEVLAAYRASVKDAGRRAVLMDALQEAATVGCTLDAPDMKRLPASEQAPADWEHLLRRKSLIVRTQEDVPLPDWLWTANAVTEFAGIIRALHPVVTWVRGLG